MRGDELLDKMELVDPAYVEEAARTPRRRRVRVAALAACACLVLAVCALWIPANRLVLRGCWGDNTVVKGMITGPYTEEFLFDPDKSIIMVRGRVIGLENITAFGDCGARTQRCIVTVRVRECYRGDVRPGRTIRILLPFSVDGEDHDSLLDNLRVGMEGIFLPWAYGDEEYDFGVRCRDLAPYGYGRLLEATGTPVFLAVDGRILYDVRCFGGTDYVRSLDDAGDYIREMLEKYGNH